MFYSFLKRSFDLVGAAFGLLILAPVGLVLGLLVRLSDGGPIFYCQTRIGQFGRPFRIWKFRSMIVNADQAGLPVTGEGDPRITRIGRFLRKTKLDELPQLWNVLLGEMTFVGPRPEVPRYADQFTAQQREILKLKPGITDLATVLFRNEEALLRGSRNVEDFYLQFCLPKKIELNLRYAHRASVLQDLWIIAQTLCPYWLGVLTIYGLALVASFWFAFLLRFDFQVSSREYEDFWRFLPQMVLPQMFLLTWRRQLRGLMSYFSVPEMRQTAAALGLALAFELGVWAISRGRLAPGRGIILIHFLVSFMAICSVRMLFRFARERSSHVRPPAETAARRVAIIGTGELATKLALDFATSNDHSRVVAFFDDDPHSWHTRPHDIPVVGMPECLLNEEWRNRIDEVIVALPEEHATRRREIGQMLRTARLKVTSVSTWPLLEPLEA